MTKQQALFYCKEKAEYEGWMTHTMILDIYDNDEEIPDYVLDFICYPPQSPQEITIYVGARYYKMFNDAAEAYSQHLTHLKIMDDFKDEPKS